MASPKLSFYTTVKDNITFEAYLKIENRGIRKSLARLRSSSHRLNVETARYISTKKNVAQSLHDIKAWKQCCKTCCDNNVELLLQQPFAQPPIVEDEHHVLTTCPAYHHLRLQTSDHIKSTIVAWDDRLPTLFQEPFVLEFGAYVNKIFQIRFPKKATKSKEETSQTN